MQEKINQPKINPLNEKDNRGETVLHKLCLNPIDLKEFAAQLMNGADPTIVNLHGNNCLHNAIIHNRASIELVRLLLKYNIDIHAKNNNGYTYLHYLSGKENPCLKLLHFFLQLGLKLETSTKLETTSLQFLKKTKNINVLRLLIINDCPVDELISNGTIDCPIINSLISGNENQKKMRLSIFQEPLRKQINLKALGELIQDMSVVKKLVLTFLLVIKINYKKIIPKPLQQHIVFEALPPKLFLLYLESTTEGFDNLFNNLTSEFKNLGYK